MKVAIALATVIGSLVAAWSQAAELEFDNRLTEVKAPADAATVTADFPFTNKSDKTVTITKSDPGCSCLTIEVSGGKLKYAPGESGVVRTTFEMGNLSGTIDKVVALWLDDDAPNEPSVKLNVRVHIPVLVNVEPKSVKWELGGALEPQTIQILMAEGDPIRVTAVSSSSPSFTCELKTLEEGRKYDLIVTPKVIDAPGMSVIRIETDCPISKHRVQQAFAVLRKWTPPTPSAKP